MSFLDIAVSAAKKAGAVHLGLREGGNIVHTKSAHYDRVTTADTESQGVIIAEIERNYPNHAILAEEKGSQDRNSEYTWIIDPLDGTNNYSRGLPFFAVSIAVADSEGMHTGVVYAPVMNELFTAERGRGAFLNGAPITVSKVDALRDSMIFTGFYYDRDESMRETLRHIEHFFEQGIIGLRRFGAASLDICYIAAGRADGFFEHFLSPWDFAAGSLVLEEAGGRISDYRGSPLGIRSSDVIVSNGDIHGDMLSIIGREK